MRVALAVPEARPPAADEALSLTGVGEIRRFRASTARTLVLVSASLLATASAQAAPGDLDTSFGVAGMQTTDLGGSEDAAAAAIQQDGKIVVAGRSFRGGGDDFALARYNPDGSLDASFSGDGKVVTDFAGSQSARDLALQPDGKLVVAGDGVIARYNPDGTLDSSFGTSGTQATAFGVGALAIQSDGKLVVTGVSVIARYNADGTPDSSFGAAGGGTVTTGFANADVALTAGGKIVVSGTLESEIALARYNQDGTLDLTFSTPVWWGQDDAAGEVVVQPDGKVVVAASSYGYVVLESYAMILRYNPDGTPDGTFNGPLWAAVPGFAVALQSDGKIVGLTHGMLARFLADGSPDGSFGTPATDLSADVAIQADGKIVIVGSVGFSGEAPSGDFAVARYHGGSASSPPGGTAPTNSSPPTITGTAIEGEELTVSAGAWSGTEIQRTYQWRRCDSAGANCADIASATSATYPLTAADVGRTIRVRETASNAHGAGSADSAATGVVKAKPGVIAGTVLSKNGNAGIPSASVRCGAGYSTTTTTNGGYSIPNVAPGTYSCTASASGYRPSTQRITVPPSGGAVTANFSLRR
jgi:uncharacterized delta-60 repeat protein